jgi:VCBS repeat-containing protein
MYYSSKGLRGDSVWGTRNDWVMLKGEKDNVSVTIAIFDNPKNPGYPAYAHARGYGLFSLNNFGQNSYDPKQEKRSYAIKKGESVTLYHRFYVQSGSELTPDKANKIFKEFKKEY